MASSIRVCGNKIKVQIKKPGFWGGTKTVTTICGRPPDHTEGGCAPGPTTTDLLAKSGWF